VKLWGGRFSESQNALAAEFNNSLQFDWRLGEVDVRGSIAWAQALEQVGILADGEVEQICQGLEKAVERRLGELVGAVAGKLHTGRSRNDQVATDLRLWVMEAADRAAVGLKGVQAALVQRAGQDMGVILPGYTHLQRAQPVRLSHWWLSHFWPLQRDRERLAEMYRRAAWLPLGAGALAGNPFGVDREALAAALGFERSAPNSLDAVADRDFAAEYLFCAALTGVHLSRLAEMLVLFSTAEFGFIELSEAYSTGSSLMPQKKNPDPLELVRGKAGTLIGHLTGLLAVLKGTPSAYDKDLQEDKLPVFQAAEVLRLALPVTAEALRTLSINPERMRAALDPGMLATDLADYLVLRGVPFRQAHNLAGQCVRRSRELGAPLDRLPLDELQAISPAFEADVYTVFDYEASVNRRSSAGGTGEAAVLAQLTQAKALLEP
jgi:argininosuccinate lyase